MLVVAQRLPADFALVDFVRSTARSRRVASRGADREASTYEAFVLRRADAKSSLAVNWLHLGPAEPIEQAVEQWRQSGRGRGLQRIDAPQPSQWRAAGQTLRELIWDKIAPQLAGVSTVILIPDGTLTRIPWAALPGNRQDSFLIEDYALGTLGYGQQLAALALPATPGSEMLVVGGVHFDKRPTSVDLPLAAGSRLVTERGGRGKCWAYLEGTNREAERIARLCPSGIKPRLLRGTEPSEAAVAHWMPDSRYVHLATHGYFSDPMPASQQQLPRGLKDTTLGARRGVLDGTQNPLILSGLALAGANLPPPKDEFGLTLEGDGVLTAEEIVNLDLSGTELVVLSACETGLGPAAVGEGVFGLQRAFASAGAKTVIASLWKVDDAATQTLMVEFYQNLWQRKLGKLEALRQAQLTMLRRYDIARGQLSAAPGQDGTALAARLPPFYWAAFVLSDDWR